MKKIPSLILALLIAAASATMASAAMFTDFESYASFTEGGNPVYNDDPAADFWTGEWSGGGKTDDTITCEIRDGVGNNGSKGLVIASNGSSNVGVYLFATADNGIATDYSGAQYLRLWADFTQIDFRKANFGVSSEDYSLFTTDETDTEWDCPFYYSEDGKSWEEMFHGGDGCFGTAQASSVADLKGWFAFPIKDFTIRGNANWDALDDFTEADPSQITGVYLFWDYDETFDYVGQEFVLDELEFVEDYTKFEAAAPVVVEEPVVEEPVVEEPAAEEPAVVEEEPAAEEPVVEEPAVVEEEPAVEETVVIEEPVVVAEPVVTTVAPQTFDAAVICAVAAVVSLGGYSIAKKNNK